MVILTMKKDMVKISKLTRDSVTTNLWIMACSEEFEQKYRGVYWDVEGNYIDAIEAFTQEKIKEF